MSNEPNVECTYLKILQMNLNKSMIAQHALLAFADLDFYNILALQEPYLDSQSLTRANPSWVVVYPSTYDHNHLLTCSVLLIHTCPPIKLPFRIFQRVHNHNEWR